MFCEGDDQLKMVQESLGDMPPTWWPKCGLTLVAANWHQSCKSGSHFSPVGVQEKWEE